MTQAGTCTLFEEIQGSLEWSSRDSPLTTLLVAVEYEGNAHPPFMKGEPSYKGKKYYPLGLCREFSVKNGPTRCELELRQVQYSGPSLQETLGFASALLVCQEAGKGLMAQLRFPFVGGETREERGEGELGSVFCASLVTNPPLSVVAPAPWLQPKKRRKKGRA